MSEYEFPETAPGETPMLMIKDETFYYCIWGFEEPLEVNGELFYMACENQIRTSFSYRCADVGWGCGEFDYIYKSDIAEMYKQLIDLRAGHIDELDCTFKSDSTYVGYYIKINIEALDNNKYDAHFEIVDDTEIVKLNKIMLPIELDEQIEIWGNCARTFPVK